MNKFIKLKKRFRQSMAWNAKDKRLYKLLIEFLIEADEKGEAVIDYFDLINYYNGWETVSVLLYGLRELQEITTNNVKVVTETGAIENIKLLCVTSGTPLLVIN